MRKRWLIVATTFAIALVAFTVTGLRSPTLKIERTIIAELPKGMNQLIKTDLNSDGESELLVTWSIGNRFLVDTFGGGNAEDPRIWLIRSPLTNPQAIQLPYVCRLIFPTDLLPLRVVPVEEGRWFVSRWSRQWVSRRLGWLRIQSGQIRFEPFCDVRKLKHPVLSLSGVKMPILLVDDDLQHRFVFYLHADGTWQPIDPAHERVRLINYPDERKGDFDGDGLKDAMELLSKAGSPRLNKLMIRWGNGAPSTELSISRYKLLHMNFWTTDADGDGCWEIITLCRDDYALPKRWDLTVWRFHHNKHRFIVVAQLAGTAPSISHKLAPFGIMPILYTTDLNGDKHKDFMLVWKKLETFPGISAVLQTECIAVQVIWWRGKSLQARTFSPHELAFPTETENLVSLRLQILDKERIAIADKWHQKRHFAFRFLSFRPLRVQLWEWRPKQRCVVMRLPNGDAALDLCRWKKLAELPGNVWLRGDWDSDGRQELLLQQWVIRKQPSFPFIPSSRTSAIHVLYLACIDGHRVRWAKIVPPLPTVSACALPLQTRDGAALFVLWQASDKTLLERIRWRLVQ